MSVWLLQLMDLVLKQIKQETADSRESTAQIKQQLRARRQRPTTSSHAQLPSAPSSPGEQTRPSDCVQEDAAEAEWQAAGSKMQLEDALEGAGQRMAALELSVG